MTEEKCPKCSYTSGDDWKQCQGYCPRPMSPHYVKPPLTVEEVAQLKPGDTVYLAVLPDGGAEPVAITVANTFRGGLNCTRGYCWYMEVVQYLLHRTHRDALRAMVAHSQRMEEKLRKRLEKQKAVTRRLHRMTEEGS